MFMFVTKPENQEKCAKLTISKLELNNILSFIHQAMETGETPQLQRLWDSFSRVDLLDESDASAEVDLSCEDLSCLLRILLVIDEKQLEERDEKGFYPFWDDVVARFKNTHSEGP